jgi:hypothetical protein
MMKRSIVFVLLWFLFQASTVALFAFDAEPRQMGFLLVSIALAYPILLLLFGYIEVFLMRRVLAWNLGFWPVYSMRSAITGVLLLLISALTIHYLNPVRFYAVFSIGLCLGQAFAFPSAKQRGLWILVNLLLSIVQVGAESILSSLYPMQTNSWLNIFRDAAFLLPRFPILAVVLLDIHKMNPAPYPDKPLRASTKPRHFLLLWLISSVTMFFPWIGFFPNAFLTLLPFVLIPALAFFMGIVQNFGLNHFMGWQTRWWTETTLFGSILGLLAALAAELLAFAMPVGIRINESLTIGLFTTSYIIFRFFLALIQCFSIKRWRDKGLWLLSNLGIGVLIQTLMLFQWSEYPFHAWGWAGFLMQFISAAINAYLLLRISAKD